MYDQRQNQSGRQQLEEFLRVHFCSTDLVEIRAIAGRSMVHRQWSTASQLAGHYESLRAFNNEGANIYFGVNPRLEKCGRKESVYLSRCIWADLDHIEVARSRARWEGLLPEPNVIVDSGHGVHLYWKLELPQIFRTKERRERFESVLRHLYRDLGSDSTHDVNRLLRLPGFWNHKQEPVPCRLVYVNNDRRLSIEQLARWFALAEDSARTLRRVAKHSRRSEVSTISGGTLRTRIQKSLRILDVPSNDRSRRDFRVVCDLLRLGLSPAEITTLVQGHSKFVDPNYTSTTITNAIRSMRDFD